MLDSELEETSTLLRQTRLVQPLLFSVEYALARLWLSWGVSPSVMIGHSLGEYVAACLSGIFSVEDAVKLVCARGEAMQRAAPGAMLALSITPHEFHSTMPGEWDLAAVNAPSRIVVSGEKEIIGRLQSLCETRDILHRYINEYHGFHSRLMDDVLDEFREAVASVSRAPPTCPMVSSVTGAFITDSQAKSADYWVEQLRKPVLFAKGIELLGREDDVVFCEVGDGQQLTAAIRMCGVATIRTMATLPGGSNENRQAHEALASLVRAGIEPDWDAYHGNYQRPGKISLPPYAFQRRPYWVTEHFTKLSEREGNSLISTHRAKVEMKGATEMVNLWRELFRDTTIDEHTDFFDIGGDSLIATRLLSRVRDQFGVTPTVAQLFETRTPSALAARLLVESPL